jgi:hypothetical protein
VVLRTVWDSTDDAQEFSDAIEGWIGDASSVSLDGARVDVVFASDAATLTVLRSALGSPA